MARRLGAGIMQYRLQARYRRDVTRQYLRLPLSWHQRHPTGQLLSNANADVEAVWFPIAPLPMAVGRDRDALRGRRRAGADRPRAVADRVPALPGDLRRSTWSTSAGSRRSRPGRSSCAPRSAAWRTSRSTARWSSRPSVARRRRRSGSEAAAHELRDAQVAVGRVRGVFDPALEALPTLGVLAVLLVGIGDASSPARSRPATWCRSRTCSRSWPSRCAPSGGCSVSCRAASSAGTACRGCSRRRAG